MIVKIESTDVNVGIDFDRIVKNSMSIKKKHDKKRTLNIDLYYKASETLPTEGQDIQVYDDTTIIFGGIIKTITYFPTTPAFDANTYIGVSIVSDGYNSIPTRRTVNNTYLNTTAGAVISDIITDVLSDEGITEGTVSTGATINSYITDIKSTGDILDELADASGYVWNITDSKVLNFTAPSTLTTSSLSIVEGDGNHFGFSVSKTLNNYRNKQFVVGGSADDPIVVNVSDATEISARASIEGNSGVYGNIYKDSNIQDETDATTVAEEMLARYKNIINAKFKSYTQYELGKVMTINYAVKYGINSSFLITSETIKRKDHQFIYEYTCEARDITDFSSKPKDTAVDFFKKLAEGGLSGGGGSGLPVYFAPVLPTDLSDYNVGDIILVPTT